MTYDEWKLMTPEEEYDRRQRVYKFGECDVCGGRCRADEVRRCWTSTGIETFACPMCRDEEEGDCFCGSGLPRRELVDARGIFCAFVCDNCEERQRAEFRPEIFKDSNYETDEPIEEDE
jgi:transcription elongation factor Elf1